jgi:hypothetical protein
MLNNMNAIFDTHSQAVAALAELRGLGIPNSHLVRPRAHGGRHG